jgi:hypothetical protein
VTISDLQTGNKLWNWGKISSPTKQNLRMNFHTVWRPELKAMGDLLADPAPSAPPASPPATAVVAASTAVGGLTGRRGTLCYPCAVRGV